MEWHIVVKTWEENVVVKSTISGLVPFLPGAGVLSAGDEEEISGLEENTFSFVSLNLASAIEVNENNIWSVEVDVVEETVLEVVGLTAVVVVDSTTLLLYH